MAFSQYLLVIFLIAGGVAVALSQSKQKDPYGLFHLDLNRLPSDDSDEPKTEWLNMGYWKVTLALKLILAVRLQRGARVLDVGHGTGESLIMLMSDEAIPRPATLTGITSLYVHHERSKARVARLQIDITKVTLALGHPLHPLAKDTFDAVLRSIVHTFQHPACVPSTVARKTGAGGRIALSDICYVQGSITRAITSMEEYVRQMLEIGYVDVELEDVTQRFLKQRGTAWWVFAAGLDWYFRSGARFIIVSGSSTLGKGLQDLGMSGMSEGELQRRTDMVARLQDDCEKLSRVVTVARQVSSRPSGGFTAVNPASESDRAALLGAHAAASKPISRVFGVKAEPKETEQTRPLDNVGLLSYQQTRFSSRIANWPS
ncbi:hypothetical protein BDQ17DRAFT_1340644 [Cyathus striatus]|nr:hypothetical protein BDQ17DRAFT_1340644 [Cyathus striatus]